jgi:hypothetical protein
MRCTLPKGLLGVGALSFAALVVLPARPADAKDPLADRAGAASAAVDATTARVYPIDVAAREGLLDVRGSNPKGCTELDLTLHSLADGPIVVDVAGRHLRPSTGDVQRLGLAHPTTTVALAKGTTPGTCPITLTAGATRTIRMHTLCMDYGTATPRPSDLFVLPESPTPVVVEVMLRWWVAHPDERTASLVQHAVWEHQPSFVESGRESLPATTPDETLIGQEIRSYAGVAYLLHNGVLTSLDASGVRRFQATGILSIWPMADGLFVVAKCGSGCELLPLGTSSGVSWTRLAEIERGGVAGLVVGSSGALMLSRTASRDEAAGALSFATGSAKPLATAGIAAADQRSASEITIGADGRRPGKAIAAIRLKGVPVTGEFQDDDAPTTLERIAVYDINLANGKAARRSAFAGVESIAMGPAGTFAITSGGRLVRVEGDRLIALPFAGKSTRVLAVGAWRVLLLDGRGQVVSMTLNGLRADVLPADAIAAVSGDGVPSLSVDPKTDQVVWLSRGTARRWTPGCEEPDSFSFTDATSTVVTAAR